MLIDATYPIREFMDFINRKWLCDTPCKVIFLEDFDCVKSISAEENNTGFALYYSDSCTMYVAGDISGIDSLTRKEQHRVILTSIAHEYIHHIQNVKNKGWDEAEVENQAHKLVEEYYERKSEGRLY